MTDVVGIICEYDPFHKGHSRQFQLIKDQLPHALIVCVMSGCFTQRGMPALFSPAFRAQAALLAGADLVLELPALFALREAEHFALGGVSILHQLPFVTHISFGCENENLPLLQKAAVLLENPGAPFPSFLKSHLQKGLPFAAAQGQALIEALESQKKTSSSERETLAALFSAPNNILGLCYLRALLRLQSTIKPLPVLRQGLYHATTLESPGFPSATAVRKALLNGEKNKAEAACGYAFDNEPLCPPDALDQVLLSRLRKMDKNVLSQLPHCAEGLENLLYRACRKATDRNELMEALKSKRYTHARLSRLLSHGMLGITQTLQGSIPLPPYARLLGLRKEQADLHAAFKRAPLPVLSKAAKGPMENPAYQLDMAAYDLWALGAKIPAGLMLRQPVQVL